MTSRLIFSFIISLLCIFTHTPNILCEESKQEKFFQQLFGSEYDKATKSLSNNDKINFAKKVLKDIDSIEKKSYQRYAVLKTVPLVSNYKSGYPVAVALLQKSIDNNNDDYKLRNLPQLCDLQNLLAKSILSSKKTEKLNALSELFKSQILHAKLLFNICHYKASADTLKLAQQTARNLKIKKAMNKTKSIMKILTSKVAAERIWHQKLNLLKADQNVQEALIWVGDYYLNEFGDIAWATPYVLKAPKSSSFAFIQLHRKYLASKLKASKAPLYFTDNDLDLSNDLLFKYLMVPEETSKKSAELYTLYLKEDKTTVVKALTLGENLIDAGEKITFNQHADLAQLFMTKVKQIKNPNARIRLIAILDDMIKKTALGEIKLDEAQKTIFKILAKDIKELRKITYQQEDFIDFDAIPTEVIKPETKKLKEGKYILQGLITKGVRSIKGNDVSNPKNAKKYSRHFQFSAELNNKKSSLFKWSKVNHKTNSKDFSLKCQAGKCSIFHSFVNSNKAQNVQISVFASNVGSIGIFLNGKLMTVSKKADTSSFKIKLSKKQYMLRIVFFHLDRDNEGAFHVTITPAKKDQKLDIDTSNLTLD